MIKNIIFDFDGVILDSVQLKTEAFRKLFEGFPKEKVNRLIKYHIKNAGVSRYKKIKYFFITILNKSIDYEEMNLYAQKYSELTKQELANPKYLIKDSIEFIKNNYEKYNFHIASGADENDLKYICDKLKIGKYFLSINGSPKIKSDIIKDILQNCNYKKEETMMIGDSINDFEASKENGIKFYGYNNLELKNYHYLHSLSFLREIDAIS